MLFCIQLTTHRPEPMRKQYIQANDLLVDSFELALNILRSPLRPDLLIGLWRGGTPIAIAVHEALKVVGLPLEHMVVKTAVYRGIDQRNNGVAISGLEPLSALNKAPKSILVVDDVFDSGTTMKAVIEALKAHPASAEATISVATVWWKPARNQTAYTPDYWVHQTDDWLVFPHELEGLSTDELAAKPGAEAMAAFLAHQPGET